MKKHQFSILYACIAVVSIVFIGISFFQPECHSWEIWQSVFLSMGTGLLSAIVLSTSISFIEKRNNKKNLIFFTYNISSCVLAIYQRILFLIDETLNCECEYAQHINEKTLLQITKYIKQKLSQLTVLLAPITVSPNGEATHESLLWQENAKNLNNSIITWTNSIKIFEDKLTDAIEGFKQNKLILVEKNVTEKEYNEIVAFAEAFCLSKKSSVLDISFFKNLNTILQLLEQIDLSLLDLDGNYNYEYIAIKKMKYIKTKNKKRSK